MFGIRGGSRLWAFLLRERPFSDVFSGPLPIRTSFRALPLAPQRYPSSRAP